jgi:predicted enzyme related to lactoylglutathione lyase
VRDAHYFWLQTTKKAIELGGALVLEKTPEGDNGFYAVLSDVEGNPFGIYKHVA